MTALTNDYIWEILGGNGFVAGDDLFIPAAAGTTQATAGFIAKGQLHRVTANATANAAILLKSIMSNDNPQLLVIVNDSANAVVLFPYKAVGAGATDTTENINGAATGFSVAAASTAVLFSSLVQPKRKGGSSGVTPALNWSAAIFN